MPLINLKTNLKSFKYGHDTPGGGNSGQPYIKTDINDVDTDFNRFRQTKFDDGLVRGGIIGSINASTTDVLRIGKLFKDFPKGPLFLAKQAGLQLSNPQLEHKNTLPTNRTGANRPTRGQGLLQNIGNFFVNTSTSIGAFISNTANRIENAVGPTRIYNLGINTLAQVPINAVGGHIMRHGFLPNNDESKLYYSVVKENNFQNNHNRLEGYANEFYLGGFSVPNQFNSSTELTSYLGGPSSVYGIGNTTIRKSYDSITNNWANIYRSLSFTNNKTGTSYSSTVINNNSIITIGGGSQTVSFGKPIDNEQALSQFSIFQPNYSNTTSFIDAYSRSIRQFNTLINKQIIAARKRASQPPSSQSSSTSQTSAQNQSGIVVTSNNYTLKSSNEIKGGNTDRTWRTKEEMQTVLDKAYARTTNPYTDFNTVSSTQGTQQQLPDRFLGASRLDPDVKTAALNSSIYDYTAVDYSDIQPALRKFSELKKAIDSTIESGSKSNKFIYGIKNAYPNHPVDNKNDIVTQGPSSYVGISNPQQQIGDIPLDTPATVYDYAGLSPATKTYANLVQTIEASKNPFDSTFTLNRNDPNYKYNNGGLGYLSFDRTNDRIASQDDINLSFTPIDPFTGNSLGTIQFLAYITDFSDKFNSTWGDVKYVGRAEKFYIFNEFKRDVSFGFNIPCYNGFELDSKHEQLNTLVSILAGSYNNNNLLGGVITNIKVGNYVNNEPSIINSIDYSIIEDSSWDLDKELAFYLKVTVNATIIHKILPRYGANFIKSYGNSSNPTPLPPRSSVRQTKAQVVATTSASTASAATSTLPDASTTIPTGAIYGSNNSISGTGNVDPLVSSNNSGGVLTLSTPDNSVAGVPSNPTTPSKSSKSSTPKKKNKGSKGNSQSTDRKKSNNNKNVPSTNATKTGNTNEIQKYMPQMNYSIINQNYYATGLGGGPTVQNAQVLQNVADANRRKSGQFLSVIK